MTESVKTRHNSAFFKLILFLKSTYPSVSPGKVSALYILIKTVEVTILQSSSNRKINLYSKYRENKLQPFTKTDVTYE